MQLFLYADKVLNNESTNPNYCWAQTNCFIDLLLKLLRLCAVLSTNSSQHAQHLSKM